jgi:hypothetical protein
MFCIKMDSSDCFDSFDLLFYESAFIERTWNQGILVKCQIFGQVSEIDYLQFWTGQTWKSGTLFFEQDWKGFQSLAANISVKLVPAKAFFKWNRPQSYIYLKWRLTFAPASEVAGGRTLQFKQVGTPTLPTAIPLKFSSSMRATLVFNLFFKW